MDERANSRKAATELFESILEEVQSIQALVNRELSCLKPDKRAKLSAA
jgi:hypothetical protein